MALGQEDSSSRGGSPGLRDGMLLSVPYSRISHCSMGWAQLPAGFGTWRWGESHRCLCLQNPTGITLHWDPPRQSHLVVKPQNCLD